VDVSVPEPASVAVRAGAGRLRCLVWGRDGDPTALLIHGNGGHAYWWAPLVPALVPGWRLIAPDLRGHGESDWAEPPAYDLDDFAGDLATIRHRLAPGPVALVGHSMGGRVLLGHAARQPAGVRGVALLDSRLGDVDPALASRWRGRVTGLREGRGYASREAAIAAFRFVPEEADVAPEIVRLLGEHAVRERAPGDWTFRFDRAVLSVDGDRGGDLVALFAALRCPVLIAGGATSWVLDAGERARLTGARPGTRIEIFPGGHHFLLAHPLDTGAVLRRFLDGLP
jgi:pimeloyl-ACP methyl ester carboxylesterase